MNLNMALVAEVLSDKIGIEINGSYKEELTLEQVQIFTGGSTFSPGILYVSEGEKLPSKPFFKGFCAIISIGPSNKSYRNSDCDYLEIDKNISIFDVLNCIQGVYRTYNKWHIEMYNVLSNESGIQELLDLTVPLLENPVYFHDKNYQFVAFAEISGMPGGSDIYGVKKNEGRFSLEDLKILRETPYFEKTFETTKPTFHIDIGECAYIYDNVRNNGKYCGRVYVDERCRNFKKGDYAILGVLRRMIEKALSGRNFLHGKRYRILEEKLVSLLEGKTIDMPEFERELGNNAWAANSNYFCFYLQLRDVDILLNTMIAMCELIESKLPESVTFPYQNGIIGVVLVDGRLKTLERIKNVLQEFKLYGGVSMLFDDFNEFPLYYKQACISLNYGMKEKKSEWIHYFEDYCFSYMLNCCTAELLPDMLFPPALHKLIEHDKRKSTSYVETLRAYLEKDMKPARAMKALFIQRSTFLYRLDRINEIIGVDLEDEKTKIHFLLSFQLMDNMIRQTV